MHLKYMFGHLESFGRRPFGPMLESFWTHFQVPTWPKSNPNHGKKDGRAPKPGSTGAVGEWWIPSKAAGTVGKTCPPEAQSGLSSPR